ncbi:hypothetical protein VDR40_21530, partial [Xanthomonas campestris pv. campestris]|nr:hypothetical protein [Xanthomonas campestris pv. campestris]MEB1600059.1 hypothetical protein [Xanthomonas campestris pv. campestris]MEB1620073.1 hypothetical protein [Xanthomonas campestris pv. campestris]MEB1677739.1 hypothetical protein [Xanthomonas campestris pv. campestris]MEB1723078.1 hypothetical protein [Xanthomonas campestris pv. campestris]
LARTACGSARADDAYGVKRGDTLDPVGIPPPDPDKNAIFAVLQKYNRVGLLVPDGAPHMWHAAMESKPVRLTALGEHYRALAAQGRI